MKFKLLLDRKIVTTDTVAAQPIVGHPLSALALIGAVDLPRCNPVTVNNTYAALVTAGLPPGYTALPAVIGRPFSGWGLVGPNGIINFKVTRVVHRITYGAFIQKFQGVVDLMLNNALVIPPYNPNVQTPAGTILEPVRVSAASLYNDANNASGQYTVPLENSSYIDNQGTFSNVPGVTSTYRLLRNVQGIGVVATVVEMIPPTAIPGSGGSLSWAGRALGFVPQTTNYVNIEANYLGNQINTSAEISTEWEVEVDDNLISQVSSQTGKIYAVTTPRIPQLMLDSSVDTGNGIYTNVDGYSYLPNIALTPTMAIDITTLAGTQAVIGLDTQNGTVNDFNNAPIAAANYGCALRFGASLNAPAYDLIQRS